MALTDYDAALVGSYVATFFFGLYLVIGAECSKLLYQRYKTGRGHTYLATTHVLLLVFISARCLAVAERAMNAYKYANVSKGIVGMGNFASPIGILNCILFVLVVLVYDTFLIFRTCVVWNNSFLVIVIPVLAALADFATGIWWTYLAASFSGPRRLPTDLITSLTAFSCLTALVNVSCSGLIAYRILGMTNRNGSVKVDDSFTRVVAVVVESATATTLLSLCLVITLVARSFSSFIFSDISGPTIGIVFCSIVLRVSQGRSRGDTVRAISNELCWNSGENEDPETAIRGIGNDPIHLDSNVCAENSGEDVNFHRSTSKIAHVPPPDIPAFETAVIKCETY